MTYGYGYHSNQDGPEDLILCPYCKIYFKESEWRKHKDECQFIDK